MSMPRCIVAFCTTSLIVYAFLVFGFEPSQASPRLAAEKSQRAQVALIQLSGVVQISAGNAHTCALLTEGDPLCWGDNAYGQLGDGTNTSRLLPTPIDSANRAVEMISAGGKHTCAVLADGRVACWGDNEHGQLGDGTNTARNRPVVVQGLFPNAVAVSAGWAHTCALSVSGGVACWGKNDDGQLGDDTLDQRNTPAPVSGLESGVTAIAAGWDHSCALADGGDVFCWGDNWRGDLGDGTMEDSPVPVMTIGLASETVTIRTGNNHTCARNELGGVLCWGANTDGELGNGEIAERVLTPVDVSGLSSSVLAIAAGGDHNCAVTAAGNVLCWGANLSGQIGDGTETGRTRPVSVEGLGGLVVDISIGNVHSCAVLSDGTAQCWGSDASGQLGANGIGQSSSPTDVLIEGIATPTPVSPTATPATPTATLTPVPPAATHTATHTPTSSPKVTPAPTAAPTAAPTETPSMAERIYLAVHAHVPVPTAVQGSWQPLGGGPGSPETVDSLAVNAGTLFATDRRRTGAGGGIYQRTINGCARNVGFNKNGALDTIVLGIEFDGTRGLAAAFTDGLYFSNNSGVNWTASTGVQGEAYSVAFAGSTSYAGVDNRVYQSSDGGVNWQELANVGQPINVIRRISSSLWLGTDGGGVQELTLGNNTLIPQSDGLTSAASRQIWDIYIADIDTLYIATFDGVFQGNGFDAWQRVGAGQSGNDLAGVQTRSLDIIGDRLYAGTLGQGVFRMSLSDPRGWTQVTNGHPASATWSVRDLHYDDTHCQGLLAGTDEGVWLLR